MRKAQIEKLNKRIELELRAHFRIRTIIKVAIKYFKARRPHVIRNGRTALYVYIRQLICFIAYDIYGIKTAMIGKYLHCTASGVRHSANVVKTNITSSNRLHSDIENIRAILNKEFNANKP